MERFNIFGSENTDFLNENGHSLFLKRLLSPNGKHGQGDLFLKRFVKDVLGKPFDETQKWYSEEEVKAGTGRVDLYIHSNELSIVIENKIGATDQDAQLYRYWRNKIYGENNMKYDHIFDNERWKRGVLVYLTPDGIRPSDDAMQRPYCSGTKYTGFPDELPMDKITRISYKKDIRNWLCNCLRKIDRNENPRLHSVLEQYVEWIEKYLK